MPIKRGDCEAGKALADWLNAKKVPASCKRVAGLARDLATLCRSADMMRIRAPHPSELERFDPKTYVGDLIEQGLIKRFVILDTGFRTFDNAACARAVEALRCYSFRPFINPVKIRTVRAFQIELVPASWSPKVSVGRARKSRGRWPTPKDITSFPAAQQEAWLVLLLMGLTSSGEIVRLRQCKLQECGKWFFAEHRNDKVFCDSDGVCRNKARATKPT